VADQVLAASRLQVLARLPQASLAQHPRLPALQPLSSPAAPAYARAVMWAEVLP
jgi:hypothetical protein